MEQVLDSSRSGSGSISEKNHDFVTVDIRAQSKTEDPEVRIYHIDHIDKFVGDTFVCSVQQDSNSNENSSGAALTLTHDVDDCATSRLDLDHTHSPPTKGRSVIRIKHNDHYDILIGNRLHHQHDGHCDDHGRLDVIRYDPGIDDVSLPLSRRVLKLWRFIIMMFLTGGFFFTELISGIIIGSLALQADAFHMLADLAAMIMAFYAQMIATKRGSDKATFGLTRSEIIGGLINSVFLLASCLFITIDAIQRMIDFKDNQIDVDQINVLIIVGGVGLLINLIGIIVFGCGGNHHGHSHGHSHSHTSTEVNDHSHNESETSDKRHHHSHKRHKHSHDEHKHRNRQKKAQKINKPKRNHNIRALFLHIIGDALGSVGVIASGLIIKYVDSDYRFLSDPIISLFIVLLITISAIPLIKECINILLHKVPRSIDLGQIRQDIYKIKGVHDAHHLHVWPLNDAKIIATLHVKLDKFVEVDETLLAIEKIFHDNGIHSTTIQAEIIEDLKTQASSCINIVCSDSSCIQNNCCSDEHHRLLPNDDKVLGTPDDVVENHNITVYETV